MTHKKRTNRRGVSEFSAEGSPPLVGKSWFWGIGINDYQHLLRLNNDLC